MSANHIYHICTEQSWRVQLPNRYYVHASLASEGYIHCSNASQVAAVLDRYFAGQVNLLQLTIKVDGLPGLISEAATNGELYPHIYGPVPKELVNTVLKIR